MGNEKVDKYYIPSNEPIRVVLPDEFQVVVGDKFQLYYRGVVEAVNPYIYNIETVYTGLNGKNYPRYFELTPTASDVGSYKLTITVRTSGDMIVGQTSAIIKVIAVGTSPALPLNVLCIGDSLTSGGYWVQEAHRRLTATDGTPVGNGLKNINFIGTVRANNVGWEGYGGWTWNSYQTAPSETTLDIWVYCKHDKTTEDQHSLWNDANGEVWQLETIETTRLKFTRYNGHAGVMPIGIGTLTHNTNAIHSETISFTSTVAAGGNPFWNSETGEIDFISYCSRNGWPGIDYVYTLLTWNGQASFRANIEDNAALVASAKGLIDKLHIQYPNAKIKVLGIQMPSVNGGTGANYGASGVYSNAYGLCRTVMGVNLAYQSWANEDAYSDFIEFINISGQFDSENNMPEAYIPVNTRSSKTELRGTNGVHPSIEGYYQIGDAVYRNMIKSFTI